MPPDPPAAGVGSLVNFRDLGGLQTADGRWTRPHTLFRSDSLHGLSEDQLDEVLASSGIVRVIDLRSEAEVTADGIGHLHARDVEHLHRPLDRGAGNAALEAPEGARLLHRYLEYLETCGATIVLALRDASRARLHPTAIHCRLGKDRTGIVVGLLLELLGVPRDEIARDYGLTARALESLLKQLASSEVYAANVRALPAEMYLADENTMRRFLAAVEEEFGGARQWAERLGFGAEDLANLREQLLTDAAPQTPS